MRGARASIATLAVTLGVSLGAFGLAVAAPGGHARMQVKLQAAGALGLSSSRDGETLFSAAGMRPGQAVSGTLRITNTGDEPTILAVQPSGVADQAGTGGGRLSGKLALSISDVSGLGTPVQLWAGLPADLTEARLAILAKGESRDLVVTAALPAAGADNSYQGAAVSLGLTWGVRPVSDGLVPTPTPSSTPVSTPTPTPTATPVHTPAPVSTPTDPTATTHPSPPPATTLPVTTVPVGTPVDVAADELGLPAANACLSRRKFKIHLRAPNHGRVLTAVVRVGSKKPVRVKGRGRRIVAAKVSLRRFKRRTVVVKIDLRTVDGHRYRTKRKYHMCAAHR